jgi:hypothetical protein
VKIKGTCKRDDREFMVDQVILSGGACPWDGEPFQADYAVTLVDALADAQAAGTKLEESLEHLADLAPDFALQRESILGDIERSIVRLQQNLVKQG